MHLKILAPTQLSLLHVLSTMAAMELTAGTPRLTADNLVAGQISGVIRLEGPLAKGVVAISFDERLALQIMHNIFGYAPSMINDEVTDLVGELTNIVTGGIKRQLGEQGYEFEMATPIVRVGSRRQFSPNIDGKSMTLRCSSIFGCAYIESCFQI